MIELFRVAIFTTARATRPPDCCRDGAVPAQPRRIQHHLSEEPPPATSSSAADVAGAVYLVQYRHPIAGGALRSRARRGRRAGPVEPELCRRHAPWLHDVYCGEGGLLPASSTTNGWRSASQERRLSRRRRACPSVSDEMMRDIIFTRAGGVVDEARLRQGGRGERRRRRRDAQAKGVAYTLRGVEIPTVPIHDVEPCFGALEDFILKRCPAYGFGARAQQCRMRRARQYWPHPAQGHGVSRCRRARASASCSRRGWRPDHPEVLRRFALQAMREGRLVQAINRLEKLLAEHPYFSGGLCASVPGLRRGRPAGARDRS